VVKSNSYYVNGISVFALGGVGGDTFDFKETDATAHLGTGEDSTYFTDCRFFEWRGEDGHDGVIVSGDIAVGTLIGGDGYDILNASAAEPTGGGYVNCYGDEGTDRIWGGGGPDYLEGGPDRDYLYGGDGGDRYYLEDGVADFVYDRTFTGEGDVVLSYDLDLDTVWNVA
jgi:Ca2+-binding RTX toxin-like protein